MTDISNSKINEHANVENEIYFEGQYENRQNYKWCGISNGRTIPKYANFWNFHNFPNQKENLNLKKYLI